MTYHTVLVRRSFWISSICASRNNNYDYAKSLHSTLWFKMWHFGTTRSRYMFLSQVCLMLSRYFDPQRNNIQMYFWQFFQLFLICLIINWYSSVVTQIVGSRKNPYLDFLLLFNSLRTLCKENRKNKKEKVYIYDRPKKKKNLIDHVKWLHVTAAWPKVDCNNLESMSKWERSDHRWEQLGQKLASSRQGSKIR